MLICRKEVIQVLLEEWTNKSILLNATKTRLIYKITVIEFGELFPSIIFTGTGCMI